MRTFAAIIMSVLLGVYSQQKARAECETNIFLETVNAAWSASNYIQLEATLTNRVVACTNDIMAKGLLYEYYNNIDVDFFSARNAAMAFITAVSNRMPAEVIHKRTPLEMAISLVEMPIPTNFPANQSKTPEQMQYMHYWNPAAFPELELYQMLIDRINALESGVVTDEYYSPLNRN